MMVSITLGHVLTVGLLCASHTHSLATRSVHDDTSHNYGKQISQRQDEQERKARLIQLNFSAL